MARHAVAVSFHAWFGIMRTPSHAGARGWKAGIIAVLVTMSGGCRDLPTDSSPARLAPPEAGPARIVFGAPTELEPVPVGFSDCLVEPCYFPGSLLLTPVAALPADRPNGERVRVRVRVEGVVRSVCGPGSLPYPDIPPTGLNPVSRDNPLYPFFEQVGFGNRAGEVSVWVGRLPSSVVKLQMVAHSGDVAEYEGITRRSGSVFVYRSGISLPYSDYCAFNESTQRASVTFEVEEQDAQLALACGPMRPERGDRVRCSARSSSPNAALSEISWSFTDSIRSTEVQGPVGDSAWAGPIVVSGAVRVRAVLNGQPRDTAVVLAVQPRQWNKLRLDVNELGHGDLPSVDAVAHFSNLAHSHVDSLVRYPEGKISEGPNTGWWWLPNELPRIPFTVHISDAWNRGSAFARLQTGGTKVDPVTGNKLGPYCRASDLPGMRTAARRHEGSLGGSTSHASVARDWLRKESPEDSLEQAVRYQDDLGAQTFQDWIRGVYLRVVNDGIRADPDQRHTNESPAGKVPPAEFPCYLRPWN
jgi:hypothetical protein